MCGLGLRAPKRMFALHKKYAGSVTEVIGIFVWPGVSGV